MYIDFSDDWGEPSEAEFQPLLDFENEILLEAPHNDISILTQRIKRSFLDYVRQGVMLYTVQRYRLYKQKYKDISTAKRLSKRLKSAWNSSNQNSRFFPHRYLKLCRW
ncbi:MAG: hypothetical protein JGK21_19295 [Microcoleus sp. PH2017_22_RUC_O_B]|uniref:hypothetical protein n=1 Tax=Microcoleus sp. PH2017_22_RUC_O_B TaxID=2798833 RepID=UPI001DF93436|nr:hypothetical protein [Microcoleus sp. PH2017_22_RUC_O_B]MCC3542463.1 hypothetical protein [Microcoleus sp. PH2017_22_RUC_O_B]